MTNQTNSQTTTSGVSTAMTSRDELFRELLDVLRSDSNLELDADAISVFRFVIEATVGDFVASAQRQRQQDLWQDEQFKRFIILNIRKISRAARAHAGGNQPTAEQLREAANRVIIDAHDTYCASLPSSAPPAASLRGPVCSWYVDQINAGATG